jgi:mannose-6-phosphate isomerase-like protein (cupin superfamily)
MHARGLRIWSTWRSHLRVTKRVILSPHMNPETEKNVQICPPGEARTLRAFGEEVIIHLDGTHTADARTLWTEVTPPGGGPPPHYHENEDEAFFVQEGRVSFFAAGQWREVPPGSAVYAPRRSVHTFKNVGDKASRMLVSTSPSGFEKFFSRCADEFAKPAGPDMQRIVEISAEHGIHFVQP